MSEPVASESVLRRQLRHPYFEITVVVTILGVVLILAILLTPSSFPYRDFALVVGGALLGGAFLASDEYFVRSIERAKEELERNEAKKEREKAEEERRKAESERNSLRERVVTLQKEIGELQFTASISKDTLEQLVETTDIPAIRSAGALGFLLALQIQEKKGTTEQVISLAKSLGVRDEVLSALSPEWRLRVLRDEVLNTTGTNPPVFPLVPREEKVGSDTKIEIAKMIPDVFLQEIESQIFQTKGALARSAFATSWSIFALAYMLQGGSIAMDKRGIEVGLEKGFLVSFKMMRIESIIGGLNDLGFSKGFQNSVQESLSWLITQDDPSTAWTYCNALFALFFRYKVNIQQFNQIVQFLQEHKANQTNFKDDYEKFEMESQLFGTRVPPVKPANSKFYSERTLALWKEGRHKEAIAACDEAIQIEPDEPTFHFVRGNILSDMERYDEALMELDKAVNSNPSEAIFHAGKGDALRNLQQYESAVAQYDEAIKLDPSGSQFHLLKADALYKLGRFDEAVTEYDLALKLNPIDLDAHCNKGVALSELGRLEESLTEYDEAIKLSPENPVFHTNRGAVLEMLKRDKEARIEYEEAERLKSERNTHTNLAR